MTRTRRTTPLLLLAGVAFAAVAWRSMTAPDPSRYEALEDRIERSMPRGSGEAATPQVVQGATLLATISLAPQGGPDAGRAVVTVGGVRRVIPPLVVRADGKPDPASEADVDAAYAAVSEAIRALRALSSETCVGGIQADGDVPRVVTVRVLDCFLRCGVAEVNFVGAPFPQGDRPR